MLESQVKSSLLHLVVLSLCNWHLLLFRERFLTVVPALCLLPKHVDALCGPMLGGGAGAFLQTTAHFSALPGAADQHVVGCGKNS